MQYFGVRILHSWSVNKLYRVFTYLYTRKIVKVIEVLPETAFKRSPVRELIEVFMGPHYLVRGALAFPAHGKVNSTCLVQDVPTPLSLLGFLPFRTCRLI